MKKGQICMGLVMALFTVLFPFVNSQAADGDIIAGTDFAPTSSKTSPYDLSSVAIINADTYTQALTVNAGTCYGSSGSWVYSSSNALNKNTYKCGRWNWITNRWSSDAGSGWRTDMAGDGYMFMARLGDGTDANAERRLLQYQVTLPAGTYMFVVKMYNPQAAGTTDIDKYKARIQLCVDGVHKGDNPFELERSNANNNNYYGYLQCVQTNSGEHTYNISVTDGYSKYNAAVGIDYIYVYEMPAGASSGHTCGTTHCDPVYAMQAENAEVCIGKTLTKTLLGTLHGDIKESTRVITLPDEMVAAGTTYTVEGNKVYLEGGTYSTAKNYRVAFKLEGTCMKNLVYRGELDFNVVDCCPNPPTITVVDNTQFYGENEICAGTSWGYYHMTIANADGAPTITPDLCNGLSMVCENAALGKYYIGGAPMPYNSNDLYLSYKITVNGTDASCASASKTIKFTVHPLLGLDRPIVNNTSCEAPYNGTCTLKPVAAEPGTAPYQYSFDGSTWLEPNQANGTYVYTSTDSPTHSFSDVYIRDSKGCIRSGVPANIADAHADLASPWVSASNVSFCAGGSASVTAVSAGNQIIWKKEGTTPATLESNVPFVITEAGTYTVEAYNATTKCASATSTTITATLNESPTATISGTTTICDGSSTSLTYTISGGLEPYTMVLNTGGDDFNVVAPSSPYVANISPSSNVTYVLKKITDLRGCSSDIVGQSATITVDKHPVANAGDDQLSNCNNDSFTLAANAPTDGASGVWTGPAGVVFGDAAVNNTTASGITPAMSPVTLTWTVASLYGVCPSVFDQIALKNNDCTSLTLNLTCDDVDDKICLGSTANFVAKVKNTGSEAITAMKVVYVPVAEISGEVFTPSVGTVTSNVWTIPNLAAGAEATLNIAFTGSSVGASKTIKCYVSEANGETYSDTKFVQPYTISVVELPNATISGAATICNGSSTPLTVDISGGVAPYTFTYNSIEVESTSNKKYLTVAPSVTTDYSLTKVVDVLGCSSDLSGKVTVTVDPTPTSNAGDAQTHCNDNSFTMAATPISGTWSKQSGDDYVISDATNAAATVTLALGKTVTLNWTVPSALGVCESAVSHVTLTNNDCTGITISSESSSTAVCVDGTVTYTATITNPASSPAATNLVVNFVYPAELTYQSASDASYNNTTRSWTIGSLASGTSTSLTVTFKANASLVSGNIQSYVYTVNDKGPYASYDASPYKSGAVVKVNALPEISVVVSDYDYCAGNTVPTMQVIVSESGKADWYAADGTTLLMAASNSYQPAAGTASYKIKATSPEGCASASSETKTINMKEKEKPQATLSATREVCQNSELVMSVTSTADADLFKWNDGDFGTASTFNVTTTTAGTQIVKVQSQNSTTGCVSEIESANITVYVKPTVSLSGASEACADELVQVSSSAMNANEYSWDGGTTYSAAVAYSFASAVAQDTIITLIVRDDATGCKSNIESHTVRINALPTLVEAGAASHRYCAESTVPTLSVTVTPAADVTADWYKTDGTKVQTGSLTYTPAAGTNEYYVVARNTVTGCQTSSSRGDTVRISVTELEKPAAVIDVVAADTAVCQNGSLVLKAKVTKGTVDSYSWTSTPAGTPSGEQYTINAATAGTQTVSLTVATADGCESVISTRNVIVNALPTIDVASSKAVYEFCTYEDIPTMSVVTTEAGMSANWYAADGTTLLQANSLTYTPASKPGAGNSATYKVVAFNSATGCESASTDVFTVTLTENIRPVVSITTTQDQVCQQSTLVIVTASSDADLYSWNGGEFAAASTFDVPTSTANTQDISVVAKNSTTGCISDATLATSKIGVTVNIKPVAVIASAVTTACQYDAVSLSGSATGILPANTEYSWNDGAFGSSSKFDYSTGTAGNYTTKLVVRDRNTLCESADVSHSLTVNERPVATPQGGVSDYTYCSGTEVATMEVSVPAGSTADWYIGATLVKKGSTSYQPDALGNTVPVTYTVKARNTTSDCDSRATDALSITLMEFAKPVASIESGSLTPCQNQENVLVATGGKYYSWNGGEFSETGSTLSIETTTIQNIPVTLQVKSGDGCKSDIQDYTVKVTKCTDVQDLKDSYTISSHNICVNDTIDIAFSVSNLSTVVGINPYKVKFEYDYADGLEFIAESVEVSEGSFSVADMEWNITSASALAAEATATFSAKAIIKEDADGNGKKAIKIYASQINTEIFSSYNDAGIPDKYKAIDSIRVDYNVTIEDVTAPDAVCSGEMIHFGEMNYDFHGSTQVGDVYWVIGDDDSSVRYSGQKMTDDYNGKYAWIHAEGSCGEASSNRVLITVNPLPKKFTLESAGGKVSYCEGTDGVELTLSGSELSPVVTYYLMNDSRLVANATGTGDALSFGNQTAGDYEVMAQYDETTCSAIMNGAHLAIEELEFTSAPEVSDYDECPKEGRVQLSELVTSDKSGLVFLDKDGAEVSDFDASAEGYSATYYVSNTMPGHCASDTIEFAVNIDGNGSFELVPSSDNVKIGYNEITVSVIQDGIGTFDSLVWYKNNEMLDFHEDVYRDVPPVTTTYKVDAYGRCNSMTKDVEVVVAWPTAMTPYDMNGKNDTFAKGYPIKVFNRFNQIVFEGEDGWDGYIQAVLAKKNVLADPGVYYYVVTLEDGTVYKGTIEVVNF